MTEFVKFLTDGPGFKVKLTKRIRIIDHSGWTLLKVG